MIAPLPYKSFEIPRQLKQEMASMFDLNVDVSLSRYLSGRLEAAAADSETHLAAEAVGWRSTCHLSFRVTSVNRNNS